MIATLGEVVEDEGGFVTTCYQRLLPGLGVLLHGEMPGALNT